MMSSTTTKRVTLVGVALFAMAATIFARTPPIQNPPAGAPPPQTPARGGAGGQRGGGGGRGRGAQIMTLTTTAWSDGAMIPRKYSQAGAEVSPPLAWSDVPANNTTFTLASFALVVHDLDTPAGNGLDDLLQWLVWNIPAAATGLPEGVAQGPQLADGTRQISVTGPSYRGPAAPATGHAHHYVFEIFALDSTIDVAAVGASPAETRAAVLAAMAGHVRGKGVMTGMFKR